MNNIYELIEWLLDQEELTTYKIAKDTGQSTQFIDRYRKGYDKIPNMTGAKLQVLSDYALKIKGGK